MMSLQIDRYLKPTALIDSDNPYIQKKAKALIAEHEDVIQRAKSLFYFVRDSIKYNMYVPISMPEHFRASNILAQGEGYCVQKAILLVALGRAAGIPSGLGFATLRNNTLSDKAMRWLGTNILNFHGYARLYLNERWLKATPTFDLEMCKSYRIVPVEFDGEGDAVFHSHNRDGKLHIEYLKDFKRNYREVPLETIWKKMIQTYGKRILEPPKRWTS